MDAGLLSRSRRVSSFLAPAFSAGLQWIKNYYVESIGEPKNGPVAGWITDRINYGIRYANALSDAMQLNLTPIPEIHSMWTDFTASLVALNSVQGGVGDALITNFLTPLSVLRTRNPPAGQESVVQWLQRVSRSDANNAVAANQLLSFLTAYQNKMQLNQINAAPRGINPLPMPEPSLGVYTTGTDYFTMTRQINRRLQFQDYIEKVQQFLQQIDPAFKIAKSGILLSNLPGDEISAEDAYIMKVWSNVNAQNLANQMAGANGAAQRNYVTFGSSGQLNVSPGYEYTIRLKLKATVQNVTVQPVYMRGPALAAVNQGNAITINAGNYGYLTINVARSAVTAGQFLDNAQVVGDNTNVYRATVGIDCNSAGAGGLVEVVSASIWRQPDNTADETAIQYPVLVAGVPQTQTLSVGATWATVFGRVDYAQGDQLAAAVGPVPGPQYTDNFSLPGQLDNILGIENGIAMDLFIQFCLALYQTGMRPTFAGSAFWGNQGNFAAVGGLSSLEVGGQQLFSLMQELGFERALLDLGRNLAGGFSPVVMANGGVAFTLNEQQKIIDALGAICDTILDGLQYGEPNITQALDAVYGAQRVF